MADQSSRDNAGGARGRGERTPSLQWRGESGGARYPRGYGFRSSYSSAPSYYTYGSPRSWQCYSRPPYRSGTEHQQQAKRPLPEERDDGKTSEPSEKMQKIMNKLQIYASGRRGAITSATPETVFRRADAEKTGTTGTVMPVRTNMFRFETTRGEPFHHYSVRFEPEVASSRFGRVLVRRIEEQAGISYNYVTDGANLYCTKRLDEERVKNLVASTAKTQYKVTMTHVGTVPAGSQVVMQLLNIIFNSIMQNHFDMKWMRGHHYDIKNPCRIEGTSYSLYPGFVSSVLQFESGTKLMMDVTHKLVSTQTVLEIIENNDVRFIRTQIEGSIVHTRYNDRTYKVDHIDFGKDPYFIFSLRNRDVSVLDYYKQKYNIEVRNVNQPLLAVRPRKSELRAGSPEVIYLVPELCHLAGISSEVRSNHHIMRRFTQQTKVDPQERLQKTSNFIRQVVGNPESKKVLENFNISLEPDSISTTARKLPAMPFVPRDLQSSTKGRILDPAHLRRWSFIYPGGMEHNVMGFLQEFSKTCMVMGMICEKPELASYGNEEELQDKVKNVQPCGSEMLMVAIRPDARKYRAVKKIACLQRAVPSQVVLCRNIENMKPSILSKVALQVACKMGGAGWSIPNMKLAKTMVIGVDIYHDSERRGCSYAGLVAIIDVYCSKYYTTWQLQNTSRDVIVTMRPLVTECLKEFQMYNKFPCEKIIVYRDGVSDGQLEQVRNSEVKETLEAMKDLGLTSATLAYVVVKKRGNTRFFVREGNTFKNPPPGTVLDREVTRPVWTDFYLINHEVRGSSLTPTHFNVICNGTDVSLDELQILTYQLCHLYFNFSGPIRVPSVCQYAHKVAFLIGQFLHEYPNQILKRKLFYL